MNIGNPQKRPSARHILEKVQQIRFDILFLVSFYFFLFIPTNPFSEKKIVLITQQKQKKRAEKKEKRKKVTRKMKKKGKY